MSFMFNSLNKRFEEKQVQFDRRISNMLPILAGRVFFDMRNYNSEAGEFNVYIEWDEELQTKLAYGLPSGGYFVRATAKQAKEICDMNVGLPVYMRLVGREGKIYPYRTYTIAFGRPYSVEFNGGILIPFEDRYEELGCRAAAFIGANAPAGSQISGSQYAVTGSQGSQYVVSRSQGSQGSYRGSSQISGSQYAVTGSQGSQSSLGVSGSQGSQRGLFSFGGSQGSQSGLFSFGGSQQRFYLVGGSQMSGSQRGLFNFSGSQFLGSQNSLFAVSGSQGSQRGLFSFGGSQQRFYLVGGSQMSGSQRGLFSFGGSQQSIFSFGTSQVGGSQRGYYLILGSQGGSQRRLAYGSEGAAKAFAGLPPEWKKSDWSYMPPEWQLINRARRPEENKGGNARFGYGLDLI